MEFAQSDNKNSILYPIFKKCMEDAVDNAKEAKAFAQIFHLLRRQLLRPLRKRRFP